MKGAYTDDEMEQKVPDEYKRLRDLTLDTLGRQNPRRTSLAEA